MLSCLILTTVSSTTCSQRQESRVTFSFSADFATCAICMAMCRARAETPPLLVTSQSWHLARLQAKTRQTPATLARQRGQTLHSPSRRPAHFVQTQRWLHGTSACVLSSLRHTTHSLSGGIPGWQPWAAQKRACARGVTRSCTIHTPSAHETMLDVKQMTSKNCIPVRSDGCSCQARESHGVTRESPGPGCGL